MNAARRSTFARMSAVLALLAVLAFTLLPTVSRALASGGGWTEVCTPQGMKLVALDDQGGEITTTLDACGLCTVAAHGAAPLPAAPVVVALPLAAAEPPSAFLHAPGRAHAWQPAQSRAPPEHS